MIDAHLTALAETALAARGSMKTALEGACTAVAAAVRAGNKVLAFGNGGSATQAQHFAAELVVRYKDDRPGLPSVALVCDGAILTACANDYSYDYVFARQVEALGRPGDVALALSTSGTSPSVVKALAAARERGLVTLLVTGTRGAAEAAKWDHGIVVPSAETAHVQEVTLAVLHLLCVAVDEAVRRG